MTRVFLGHFAAGLLASRHEPRLPLGTAFLAAQLPDAIWPLLLLSGAETVEIVPGDTAFTPLRFTHYPWSHSLLMVFLWGLAAGFAYRRLGRPGRASFLLVALVVSHWVLDVASHRPDVPVLPGGPFLGLGLWNSVAATIVVEGLFFLGAVALYARTSTPGKGFWALMALLLAIYTANLLGPPPPNVIAIVVSLIALVPILWWWGNRVSRMS
jgi:hypothetical protein